MTIPDQFATVKDVVKTQDATQEFLDNKQYCFKNILKYEFIFGPGFISTGGSDSTRNLFMGDRYKQLIGDSLQSGDKRVLDIGCGIGGGDSFIVENFPNTFVHGVDLSSNCVRIAQERYHGNDKLRFEVADVLTYELPASSFDMIYSRDVILHIVSKKILFERLLTSAKKGGKLVITDYCLGLGETDEEFNSYLIDRGYSLLTVAEYANVIERAGWKIELAEDNSALFEDILAKEKRNLEINQEEFLSKGLFTVGDLDDLLNGWDAKLRRMKKCQMSWGLFVAKKL